MRYKVHFETADGCYGSGDWGEAVPGRELHRALQGSFFGVDQWGESQEGRVSGAVRTYKLDKISFEPPETEHWFYREKL